MITLYENTRVFTADRHAADGFVVRDGMFAFVGSAEEARRAFPDAQRIDLHGRFVCPGFHDTHMHLLDLGSMLTQVQLGPASDSLAHVLSAISEYVVFHPQEAWIIGHCWNQDDFTDEARYPTRDDLDRVCPDKPCIISRVCGHVAVANSCALRLAGIDAHAHAVDGGRIVTDDLGRPTGVLEENAISLVTDRIPAPSRQQLKERLLLAMAHVNRYGITSVHSDDFESTKAPFEDVIAAYLALKAEGRMTVRVTQQCRLPDLQTLHRFLNLGYQTGWGDEWFRLGPLKLISDGSLGTRTALLNAPYTDAPETRGIAVYTQDMLDEMIFTAHKAGMQVAIHAIGDGAADRVLHAIERAQSLFPRRDARHGMVHAQVLTGAQAERMKRLGMHAYIQPIFLDYDTTIVHARLGQRAEEAYPAASLLRLGITLSGGSDCPVEPPDVLTGIQCAVTRRSVTRDSGTPYLPHEALSVRDALLAFTAFGAYASFEEHLKGRICAGMLADFTILGMDPFEMEPSLIHDIPVLQTVVGGVCV